MRAVQTADVLARDLLVPHDAVLTDRRLLARRLSCLTGMAKRRALERFGQESYLEWRYAVDRCPRPASPEQAAAWRWRPTPKIVEEETLVAGESFREVVRRVEPLWEEVVQPALAKGRGVLVIAHGDSLRALRAVVEQLTGDALADGSITPAQPLVYSATPDGRITGPGQYVEVLKPRGT